MSTTQGQRGASMPAPALLLKPVQHHLPQSTSSPSHMQSQNGAPNKAGLLTPGSTKVEETLDYKKLTDMVINGNPAVLRQVIRDNWERCLLGSNYHVAFLLNAILPQAPPTILNHGVKDFGGKMVQAGAEHVIKHLDTGHFDRYADIILSKVSQEFLDKALARRFETIDARGLVNALARAERLGYNVMDIVEEKTVDSSECVVPCTEGLVSSVGRHVQERMMNQQQNPQQQKSQQYSSHQHSIQQQNLQQQSLQHQNPPQKILQQLNPQPQNPQPQNPQQHSSPCQSNDQQRSQQQDSRQQNTITIPQPSQISSPAAAQQIIKQYAPYCCSLCQRPCSGEVALKYHRRERGNCSRKYVLADIGRDICIHCGDRFASKKAFLTHKKEKYCGSYDNSIGQLMLQVMAIYVEFNEHYLSYVKGVTWSAPLIKSVTPLTVTVDNNNEKNGAPPDSNDPCAQLGAESRKEVETEVQVTESRHGSMLRSVVAMVDDPLREELVSKCIKHGLQIGKRSKSEMDPEPRSSLGENGQGQSLEMSARKRTKLDSGMSSASLATKTSTTTSTHRPPFLQKTPLTPVNKPSQRVYPLLKWRLSASARPVKTKDPNTLPNTSQRRMTVGGQSSTPVFPKTEPVLIKDTEAVEISSDEDDDDDDIPARI